MEEILSELKLESLIPKFLAEKIDPENVSGLQDEFLSRLGVNTIGDRHRLRCLCANREKESQSGVRSALRERLALFSGHSSGKSGGSKKKATATKLKRPWTVNFVCLADRHQIRVPSASEKQILHHAGLGSKTIKLDLEDNELDVLQKITSADKDDDGDVKGFPQLKDCGGFEIMFCVSGCKELKPLNCSWAVKDIKANVGSQTKLYLRPIQKKLSTASILPQNKSLVKEKCQICNAEFLMKDLRQHVYKCKSKTEMGQFRFSDSSVSDSEDDIILERSAFSPQRSQPTSTSVKRAENYSEGIVEILETSAPSLQTREQSFSPVDKGGPEKSISSVTDIISNVVTYCTDNDIVNPVEILRCLQKKIVTGQPLEVTDVTQCSSGESNFILVNRDNLLASAFSELQSIKDYRLTLEVQFYEKRAQDLGGPRKEFFRLALSEIKRKYFDHGIRQHLSEEYYLVGLIMGLSIVQNGKIPTFLGEDLLQSIFQKPLSDISPAVCKIREGLQETGIYQICEAMPIFIHLFRPSPARALSIKMLTMLLKPSFSELGSNKRKLENAVYEAFTKYLREAASGRRGSVTLGSILQFVTGTDEEPVLGFELHPSLKFQEVVDSFIPMANTCANTLYLPHPTMNKALPQLPTLFALYDYAFVNAYFGNV